MFLCLVVLEGGVGRCWRAVISDSGGRNGLAGKWYWNAAINHHTISANSSYRHGQRQQQRQHKAI
jgi:hypothetical protein